MYLMAKKCSTNQRFFKNELLLVKIVVCMLWQYRLWSFQGRDKKLERFLHKNQHTQRTFLNFENWTKIQKNTLGMLILRQKSF